MRSASATLCVMLAALLGAAVRNAPANGQTIQLPSFSSFSVNTTVLAPDSGPSPLAQDRRATTLSRTANGLPPNRVLASERQAAGAAMVAKIHDANEAEQALLSQGRAAPGAANQPSRNPLAPAAGAAGLSSVGALSRAQAERAAQQQRESQSWVERAKQAQAAGKSSVALAYYRNAARLASGPLKQAIDANIKSLETAAAPTPPRVATQPKR